MSRRILTIALALLVASAALAQEKKNELTVFSNITDSANRPGGSYGLSFARMVAPRLSVQLAVANETHHTYNYIVRSDGSIVSVQPLEISTLPIDLSARYHWQNDTRWKPYLGAGLRYVRAPNVGQGFGYDDHLNPEVVGGVAFLVRPNLGISLDAKQLGSISGRGNYDALLKVSLGLDWRF